MLQSKSRFIKCLVISFILVFGLTFLTTPSSGQEILHPDETKFTPILWETDQVSLRADGVFIYANGQEFYADTAQVNVSSDPGSNDYTTLEMIWQENNLEMRIFIYFYADGTNWWTDEIRTYDGQTPYSDWIYYTSNRIIEAPLGEGVTQAVFDLEDTASGSRLYFKNLQLQAFLPRDTFLMTDFNQDGLTNLFDYSILVNELSHPSEQYDVDLNNDGFENLFDYSIWLLEAGNQ